jgi:transposase
VKTDGRQLHRKALDTIRALALARIADGEAVTAVMQSYGLCRTTVYKWQRKLQVRGGDRLLSAKPTGRPPRLTPKQKAQVFRWLNGKDPRQYGFDFGLWTRQLVAALVQERFGVALGVTAVGRLLAELHITPQKPLRRAYERDPEAVARWERERYPALRRRAKKRRAAIFFLDEAGVRSDAPLGRTWAPRGKTPIVPTSGQRQAVNAISAVNPRGAFWYRVFTGRLNAGTFRTFLQAFLRGRRQPVFLVVDGHPAHRAHLIAQFVQAKRGRLELHFLPGYAPDLNPDEFVWNHLRQQGVTKTPLRQNESLHARVEADLATIKADRKLVRSFFAAPSVAYILN